MSERPPNEVSAALVQKCEDMVLPCQMLVLIDRARYQDAEIDRLTRDLDQARRERDETRRSLAQSEELLSYLDAGFRRNREINWKERAETAERELSEARAALESERALHREGGSWAKRAAASESSLREHAEVIVVLRDAFRQCAADLSSLIDLAHNSYDVNEWCAKLSAHEATIAAPNLEVASRLSAERRAEMYEGNELKVAATAARICAKAIRAMSKLETPAVIDKTESDVTG